MQSDREVVVRRLFERLSARDFDGAVELLGDDFEFDLAYAPDFLPMPVRGGAAMKDLLTSVIGTTFDPFRLEITTAYPVEDGETLVAEYESDAVVIRNGRRYRNRYVGIFRVSGGEIRFWREYHDPEAAAAAVS